MTLVRSVPFALFLVSGRSAQPAASKPAPGGSASAASGGAPAGGELTEALRKKDCECRVWDLERMMSGKKASADDAKAACADADPNVDCLLTFGDAGCDAVVECTRGEPARMPTCRKGYAMQAMNQCLKTCADGVCPPKMRCDTQKKQADQALCYPE